MNIFRTIGILLPVIAEAIGQSTGFPLGAALTAVVTASAGANAVLPTQGMGEVGQVIEGAAFAVLRGTNEGSPYRGQETDQSLE